MIAAMDAFLDGLVTNGLEYFRSYYGEYRAKVVRNDDPENRGRVQVSAPPFGSGESLDLWLDPAFNGTGPSRGEFWPPEVGDTVWVCFDRGRPDSPKRYIGGWHGVADMPTEFATSSVAEAKNKVPERRGFVTRMGHTFVVSDEHGKESISLIRHIPDPGDAALSDRSKSSDRSSGKWSTLLMEPDGGVRISNDNGSFLHLDAASGEAKLIDENGNSITLGKSGIKAIDSKGNLIAIDGGKVNIIATGDVTVNAPTFSSVTGGTNLSKGASEPVVLGRTWTLSRAQMNIAVAVAHQLVGVFLTILGPAAQALVPALSPPASLAYGPAASLAAVLLPFFQAIAAPAIPAGAASTQAGVAVTTFEAAALTYLSQVTKTA